MYIQIPISDTPLIGSGNLVIEQIAFAAQSPTASPLQYKWQTVSPLSLLGIAIGLTTNGKPLYGASVGHLLSTFGAHSAY